MRFSLGIVVALSLSTAILAQPSDSAKARAQAALALSRIKHDTPPTFADRDAKCKASLALAKRQRERGACVDDIDVAMDRAAKENKWVFVWVGMTCHDEPSLRAEFPGVIHCHTDALNGNATPRLLVGPMPDGSFQPMLRSKLNEKTPAAIRDLLNKQTYPRVSSVARVATNC